MDATTDQIKREIEEARGRISETTSQLGERIRATFDWRQQVGEHPFAATGLAAGAGFLLGTITARAMAGARAAPEQGEPYAYDRLGRDVEAGPPTAEARGMAWPEGAPAPAERPQERPREGGGIGRAGAVTGLLASFGAALQPQLQEIGRNLADQLKDLSNHLIGQGKEAMKQRVDEWRSRGRPGGRPGDQGVAAQAPGGSTLSSESAGARSSGSDAEPIAGSATSPGLVDARDTRTPQSRESAGAERRLGGS